MKRSIALFVAAAALAAAQTAPEGGRLGIGEKLKQNAESLKRYSYKRRTEIQLKSQSRGARVDLVRYVDGKMETVPLETPARPAGEGRGGRGLRGKMVEKRIEKKKEEMKEDVERLTALLHRFSPGSDSMRGILEKATITRTGPAADADVKVMAKGIEKPSDSFTLIWSVANHRPAKVEIHAESDGKPVSVAVEYAALPDGTFYPAHTVISAPKKELAINIDTFEYTAGGEAK